jgi:hypothetical protein
MWHAAVVPYFFVLRSSFSALCFLNYCSTSHTQPGSGFPSPPWRSAPFTFPVGMCCQRPWCTRWLVQILITSEKCNSQGEKTRSFCEWQPLSCSLTQTFVLFLCSPALTFRVRNLVQLDSMVSRKPAFDHSKCQHYRQQCSVMQGVPVLCLCASSPFNEVGCIVLPWRPAPLPFSFLMCFR